jgi:hypothetical protein
VLWNYSMLRKKWQADTDSHLYTAAKNNTVYFICMQYNNIFNFCENILFLMQYMKTVLDTIYTYTCRFHCYILYQRDTGCLYHSTAQEHNQGVGCLCDQTDRSRLQHGWLADSLHTVHTHLAMSRDPHSESQYMLYLEHNHCCQHIPAVRIQPVWT